MGMEDKKICKNCKWWNDENEEVGNVIYPLDPDSWEEMSFDFQIKYCHSPKLIKFERPLEANAASCIDGSKYRAKLATSENFGCVNFNSI